MIKIALIGYGKMGKTLESLAPNFDMKVVAKIDPFAEGCASEITKDTINDCDVCIEYTSPKTVMDNCRTIAGLGKPIVIGTTGLEAHLDELKELAVNNNIPIIYSSNYSVGMNIFFHITKCAAKLFSNLPNYDVSGLEIHHNQKLDSPSGTAKQLTKILLDNLENKKSEQFDRVDRKIAEEELHFASIRSGSNMGEHKIFFDSDADVITLSHNIRSRKGLAEGTLLATKWIVDKKGLFDFQAEFGEIIGALK